MSMFGYFSDLAQVACGSSIYTAPTMERVVVTGVGNTPDPKDCGYMWPDAKCVGEVLSYVCEYRPRATRKQLGSFGDEPPHLRKGLLEPSADGLFLLRGDPLKAVAYSHRDLAAQPEQVGARWPLDSMFHKAQ